jgi:uncharacterized integral membrane protein
MIQWYLILVVLGCIIGGFIVGGFMLFARSYSADLEK